VTSHIEQAPLPEWLSSALTASPPSSSGDRTSDVTDLQVGDLWVFESCDGQPPIRRIALVLDTDGAQVHVALASAEVAWASANDIILPTDLTGCPYELMIQPGVHGRVWWRQASHRVGIVNDDHLDAILDFLWDERPTELEDLRGLGPTSSQDESRIEFERHELEAFRRLEVAAGNEPDESYGTPLIDVSILRSSGLTEEEARDLAAAFDRPDITFCVGLQGPPRPSDNGHRLVQLFGPDIIGWRLAEAAEHALLSKTAELHVLTSGSTAENVVIAPTSFMGGVVYYHALGRRDSSTDDFPLGFLDGIPVMGGDRG
jgi:hypothetical protein